MTIHLLSADVAAKIAAGEVVERPANVVKELIENSLDAGATDIRVEIREGGRRLLRITDNGHGMSATDAPLAFLRHATSKLATASDLEHIATFGFRGEALYSIAAVSQLSLLTRHRSEEFGVQMRLEAGQIVSQQRAGAPVGTVITVEHLFFNMPARLKFLRSIVAEAGQISSVVQRYALVHPDRRFNLINEGRLVFQSSGNNDPFDALVKVMGVDDARQMVPIGRASLKEPATGLSVELLPGSELHEEVDFMSERGEQPTVSSLGDGHAASTERVSVSGFTSLPSLTRGNRSAIQLFVNRRAVEDRSLAHAVVQAYHTLLQVGRFPLAVVMIDIDPSMVDVNVHPQKLQVRFADERRVYGAVQKAVRYAVLDRIGVPDMGMDAAGTLHPAAAADGLAQGNQPSGGQWNSEEWAQRRASILAAGQQHAFDMYTPPPSSTRRAEWIEPAGALSPAPVTNEQSNAPARPASPTPRISQIPPLRVIGQIGATYIVCEGPDAMYLLDQHAAHERILYEQFMAQRSARVEGGVARQHLLEPLTLHAGGETAGLVAQHLAELVHVGFEVEPFGGDTFLVRAVPSLLAGDDPLHALEDIVSSLSAGRNLVSEEFESRLVKMVCKRAAIKAGQLLSDIEMQELVRQLEECQSPRTCPHGRPTMIQLSAGELEKAFGRV
jgi:DNA mismatch repair protein MutL